MHEISTNIELQFNVQVCPVCQGSGKEVYAPYPVTGLEYVHFAGKLTNEEAISRPCYKCKGTGQILIYDRSNDNE
jgi:RecJ-like exonuclease